VIYQIGQELYFHRDNSFDAPEPVVVVDFRRRGSAKLSNGWVVDENGIAEGTGRIPGGKVLLLTDIPS
jgi:hypothetical protein